MKENKFTKVLWAALVWMVCPILSFAQQPASDKIIAEKSATTIQMPTVVQDGDPDNKQDLGNKSTELNTECSGNSCGILFNLTDGCGDGWNNAKVHVHVNGELLKTMTIASGYSYNETLNICEGAVVEVSFEQGVFPLECGFKITQTASQKILYEFKMKEAPRTGTLTSFINNCVTCNDLINLMATNITDTSLWLKWSPADSTLSQEVTIEYGLTGFAQGTGQKITTSQRPVHITGLHEKTGYDFYFSKVCADGSGREYNKLLDVVTSCNSDCRYIFELENKYSQGWNAAFVNVYENGRLVKALTKYYIIGYDPPILRDTLTFCEGAIIDLEYIRGTRPYDCQFTARKESTNEIVSQFLLTKGPESSGLLTSFVNGCGTPLRPQNVKVVETNYTNCSLSWSDPNKGNNNLYRITYGEAGFEPGTEKVQITNNKSIFISGLTSGRIYDFYISVLSGEEESMSEFVRVHLPNQAGCKTIFHLFHDWGNLWKGNSIDVYQDGVFIKNLAYSSAYDFVDTLNLKNQAFIELKFNRGDFVSDCGLYVINENTSDTIYSFSFNTSLKDGLLYSYTSNCGSCDEPSNIETTSIGRQTIDLVWDESLKNESMEVTCVPTGTNINQGTPVVTKGTGYQIKNLTENTEYDVYVRHLCTPDQGSNWIALPSIKTNCANIYQIEQTSEVICFQSKGAFNLSGSEIGVTYTLYLNGAPTTQTLQGTGSALRFKNLMEVGSYTVVATGCSVPMQGTFELQKLPNVEFQAQIAQDFKCHNDLTGSITIHSDARPIQYSTNGGTTWQSDSVFAQLAAASYVPAVKDSNNCVFTGEIVVLQGPTELKFIQVSKTNLTDSLANNGRITITAEGGTGLLEYSIDNGNTWNQSNNFTKLGANTYVVQVKDANNCSTSYANNPVIVEFRSDVNALQNTDAITAYPNPTSAFINLSGTTGTVAYELFNQAGQRVLNGQWTEASQPIDVRNLANGIYLLKVQHSNGQQQMKVIKRN